MADSILKRLEELEKRHIGNPLIVIATTDTGESVEVSARECVARPDLHFDRVVSGNDLHDLDLLLEEMRKAADAQGTEKGCF